MHSPVQGRTFHVKRSRRRPRWPAPRQLSHPQQAHRRAHRRPSPQRQSFQASRPRSSSLFIASGFFNHFFLLFAKKSFQERRALVGKNPRCHLERVVQALIRIYLVERSCSPSLRVGAPKTQRAMRDWCINPAHMMQGNRASRTPCSRKAPSIEHARRFLHGEKFGVTCGILRRFPQIARSGNHARLG